MGNTPIIIKKFRELSSSRQNKLLLEIYNYSRDLKFFLENKLGTKADFDILIKQMEKETLGKVYRKGRPGTSNGRVINAIISKARKAGAPVSVLLTLEKLAFRGFIESLNEYGGGPDNFDDMSCRHLKAYLVLVKNQIDDNIEREKLIEETRKYLLKLKNMITDCVYETYEEVVGNPVNFVRVNKSPL